jgi:V8-like Glu-specific endopeptidase
MLRITVLSGARTGVRFELAKPVVRIGRAPDNDVAFDPNSDLDASGYHAEIRVENGQYVLVDLQSRNGVFLPTRGMQRISQHALANGEQVQLGPQGPRIGIEILGPPPAVAATAQQGYAPAQPQPYGGTQPSQAYGGAAPAQAAAPLGPPPGIPPMAPPGPPQPGKPMGQQTLLANVNAMVAAQVAAQGQPKRGKSTMEIKALVDQNVQKQTGKLRIVVGFLIIMVVIAGGAIVILALRAPKDIAAEREKCAKLTDDKERKACEAKIAALIPKDENVGKKVYETNKNAIFMLVAHKGKSYDHGGFCTAFAIKAKTLASNAHCVRAAEEFEDKGATIWAHLNDSNKSGEPKMFKVEKQKGHPKYKHTGMSITPDVGLFDLEDDEAPATVSLAQKAELKKLGSGDALYLIGFPGRTMDEGSPVAVFMYSHVGRVTDSLGQRADSYDDGWLIQHEGQTTPGTSGSPIFNSDGKVVAINAGGLLEANKQSVYKYAMRIDLLDDIKMSGGKSKKKKSDDDDDE